MTEESPSRGRDSLTGRTLAGIRWTYIATIAGAGMQLVYAGVMGRLLAPAAFGLVAMAGVAMRFGEYFARMGVGQALVQRPELTKAEVRAGFTSNVALGAVFTMLFATLAPLVLWVFDEPDVVPVLQLMSLSFLLQGFATTAYALLQRELRFRALAYVEIVAYLVGYFAIGIPLALLGFGVFSLVWAALAQGAVMAIVLSAVRRHSMRPTFRWDAYRALYGFGSRVSVISFVEFVTSFLDTLVIGRYAGADPLGQYNRAFMLSSLPLQQFTRSLSRVLFPSFSRVQDERVRLLGAYLSAIGVLTAVLLPVAAGMAVAAPEIVTVVIGPQWEPAQRVLPILAFAATVALVTHIAGVMCEAAAVLNQKLVVQVASLVTFVVLLGLAVGGPLEGYAYAVLGGEILRHLYYTVLLRRIFALDLKAVLRRYGEAGVAALIVAACVWLVRIAMVALSPGLAVALVAEIAAGGLALALAFRTPALRRFRVDLLGRLRHAGLLHADALLVRRLLWVALGSDARRTPADR